MANRTLLRLSSWVYRTLKGRGISVPKEPYQRARLKRLSKGEWGELKTALLAEIQATKHSKKSTVFAHRLIERIEEVERERPNHPLVDAVFNSGPALREHVDAPSSSSSEQLTESQQEALSKAHKNKVLFIMGAAGTGKTRVLSRIVGDFVAAGETTLLCCHTKAAVDHATARLDSSVRDDAHFQAKTFAAAVQDPNTTPVENVVIDESSMASLPHILLLTSLASKRIIFCGDPMQLPPIAPGRGELVEKWLKRDVFSYQAGTENILELYAWIDRNRDISVLLREQFDIPERIFSITNHLYYGNRLSYRSTAKGVISFIDTSKLNPPLTGGRQSPVNAIHAELVADQVGETLEKRTLTADSIGILTPFRAQRRYLQHLLALRGLPDDLAIDTVHTFQGRKKSCIVLDLTASAVDYTFQNLGGSRQNESQAVRMLNTALSRCRTHAGTEGRLIVVANYQHIKTLYPDSAVLQFLDRIRSKTDRLIEPENVPDAMTGGRLQAQDISRFQQTTETLIQEIREDHARVVDSLATGDEISEHAIKGLIWNYCDVIPRQIQLCNRLRPSGGQDYFRNTEGTQRRLEQLPLSALELADVSDSKLYSPEREVHFRNVVSALYVVLYESTMQTADDGMAKRPPTQPVYDPNAMGGETYGRIRVWLRDLRNHYQHDTSAWEDHREALNQRQVESFFSTSIAKQKPDHGLDYLRAQLFIFADIVWYLDELRTKLKH